MASARVYGNATAANKRRAAQAFDTIPAFPNWFPYNELLIDGKLIAKTRTWSWKHRGLTLFYSSSRIERQVADAHGINPKDHPHKVIVGAGELIDVRRLTRREWYKLIRQFYNATPRGTQVIRDHAQYLDPPYGFFFQNLQRFETPVPFNWPSGPVKPIGVQVSLVAEELSKIGIRL